MTRRQRVAAVIGAVLLLSLGLATIHRLVARADGQRRSRLHDLLESENPDDRRLAVLMLAVPRHGGAADPAVALRMLSTDPSPSVRMAAASAIGSRLAGERYESTDEAGTLYRHLLEAMTGDDSSDVRAWASFQALSALEGTIADRQEVFSRLAAVGAPYFEAALRDDDPQVRDNAQTAIQYIGDQCRPLGQGGALPPDS